MPSREVRECDGGAVIDSPGRPLVFVNYLDETFTTTQSGAIATYIYECCRAAEAAGDLPWVVSRPDDAPHFPWPRTRFVPYPRRPRGRLGVQLTRVQRRTTGLPKLGQRAWARRVAKAVLELAGPDCTVLLQNDPEVCVYLRKALPRARIVLLFQNQLAAREPFRSRLAASVDVVAAVSDFTAAWIADHYAIARDRVHTVYSGVASDVITPPDAPRTGLPVIGFVGRTGIEKAADVVLAAALDLARTTDQFIVQIVGSNHWGRYEEDEYQRQLNALAASLGERGIEVVRPGHVGRGDLPAWLQRSSIHVVPSRWDEPFGLTTLEGMAAGNAVVATRTGGTPEVVGDGGQLFERDDVAGLSELLRPLVLDAAARADWGQRARARAETFTWARTYAHLAALARAEPG